jgi:spermidine synthase
LYYTRLGPYGDLVRLLEARGPGWRFGVVGLGIGSLACTAEPGTRFTFFEINRGVVRLARDTSLFRSLSVCAPDADVRLGDARLTLANAPERFDLLTLDAFNSDAIPTHLLTREALALYSTRVAEGGVIAFHVSNRYLDLPRVVNALAADAGWAAAQTRIAPPAGAFPPGDSWATWITMVALARDSATLALLVATTRWRWAGRAGPVWTDDWTPLAGVLRLSRENLLGR